MQIGTRWRLGGNPPARLSEEYLAQIDHAEQRLRAEVADADSYMWTMSWLEGAPVLELEDGTLIRTEFDGSVHSSRDDVDAG